MGDVRVRVTISVSRVIVNVRFNGVILRDHR